MAEVLCAGAAAPEHGTRPLRIVGARITGTLELAHARAERPLILECCYLDEPVELSGAQLPWLELRDCRIPAVNGYGMRVDGDLVLSGSSLQQVNAFGAHVGGRVWMGGTQLSAAGDGFALNAPELTVGGGMYCNGSFRADGGVNLYGAVIGGDLTFTGAQLRATVGYALRARDVTVGGDLSLTNGFTCLGGIDLFGAEVKGQIWLNGAQLGGNQTGLALNAPLLRVGGGVYCRGGFACDGAINLFEAAIGSGLEFQGGTVNSPGSTALRGIGLSVGSDLDFSRGFVATGRIDLTRAVVRGALDLDRAELADAAVTLTDARVGALRGEPARAPTTWDLEGSTYQTLDPYRPAAHTVRWLSDAAGSYHPQPYEQLSGYYRSLGHDDQARAVRLAKERCRRGELPPFGRLWGYIQDMAIGYGYRPGRALMWLSALITALSVYFTLDPPRAAGPLEPRFEPVIYALDTLVPILGLGEKNAYVPSGPGLWLAWAGMLAGWVLAATVIAAVTRGISRE